MTTVEYRIHQHANGKGAGHGCTATLRLLTSFLKRKRTYCIAFKVQTQHVYNSIISGIHSQEALSGVCYTYKVMTSDGETFINNYHREFGNIKFIYNKMCKLFNKFNEVVRIYSVDLSY